MRALPLLLLAGCPWVGAGDLDDKIDEDGDGFTGARWGGDDCDDADPAVHPDATDLPGNDADEDCDGLIQCYGDQDGDGHGVPTPTVPREGGSCLGPGPGAPVDDDCDDTDPAVLPGGDEVAGNLADEDCDGVVDCWSDADGDGAAALAPEVRPGDDRACDGANESIEATDCDDTDPDVGPEADEVPGNAVDEDCDGALDCQVDDDDDGFGTGDVVTSADLDCADPGEADDALDCDDGLASVNPGATDVSGNLEDEDCDGTVDCWADTDDDGFGSDAPLAGDDLDCDDPGESILSTDCDDGDEDVNPLAVEVIGNLVDEDCDEVALCPVGDGDGDGVCDDIDACPGGDDTVDGDDDGSPDDCDDEPNDADSDDDSLLDGREDADHDGVVDPGETDPADPDSDGDGTCDGPRDDNDGGPVDPVDPCASVWFVSPDATEPPDGFTWASAFPHPGDAVDAMSAGQQAWVAEGSYGARGAATDPILELGPEVSLYGGFAGDEASLADRPVPPLESVLDGDTNSDGVASVGDSLHTVVTATDTRLDGFVVVGGYADGLGPDEGGAGLLVGPGVAGVTVARTRFVGGFGVGPGGAVHVGPGTDLTLLDVQVEEAGARDGAGVFVAGTLAWTGGSAQRCTASQKGGGLFVVGVARLDDVTLAENDAGEGGGAFVAMDGDLTLVTTEVVGNDAAAGDGILAGQAAALRIVSSTLADNAGDGLVADNVPLVLLHGVTVADNSGVGVNEQGTAVVTIENSILWGNATEIVGAPTVTSTCVEGGFAGATAVATDPFVRPLPDGRWFLVPTSVCADAGNDTLADTAYGDVGLDWELMSARAPFAPDAPPVDLGRHYPAP